MSARVLHAEKRNSLLISALFEFFFFLIPHILTKHVIPTINLILPPVGLVPLLK